MPSDRVPFLSLTSQNSYLYAGEIQTGFSTSGPEQLPDFLLADGWAVRGGEMRAAPGPRLCPPVSGPVSSRVFLGEGLCVC